MLSVCYPYLLPCYPFCLDFYPPFYIDASPWFSLRIFAPLSIPFLQVSYTFCAPKPYGFASRKLNVCHPENTIFFTFLFTLQSVRVFSELCKDLLNDFRRKTKVFSGVAPFCLSRHFSAQS